MPAVAMRAGADETPPRVFSRRDDFEVIGTYALTVQTEMIDLESGWDRPDR